MKRRSGFLRALLLGGTIATGFALNSTDALAAEIEPEPPVSSKQGENANEQNQVDVSLQNMEHAAEVIEGDAVAEEGYREEASEAIEKEELTEEQATEITQKEKEVLEQAAENLDEVKNEYEKVEESLEEDKATFEAGAEAAELEKYAEECEQANTTDEKVAIIEKSKEEASLMENVTEKYMIGMMYEIQDLANEWNGYEDKLWEKGEELKSLQNGLKNEQEERDKIAGELDALQHSIDLLDAEIAEYQKIADETIWAVDAYQKLDELKAKYQEELAKYEEKQQEKDEIEIRIDELRSQFEQVEAEYLSAKEEYDAYQREYEKLRAAYEKLEKEYEALVSEQTVLEERLRDTVDETEYQEILARLQAIDEEKNNLDDAITNYGRNMTMYEHENSEVIARYLSAEENYNVANDEIGFAEDDLSEVNVEMAESRKVQAELKEKIDADYDSLLQQYYSAAAQVNLTGEQRFSLHQQLEELKAKYINSSNNIEEFEREIARVTDEYNELQEKCERFAGYYEQAKREYAEREKYYQALLDYYQIADNYISALRNTDKAKNFVERSETAFSRVESAYEDTVKIIDDYFEAIAQEQSMQKDIEEVESAAANEAGYLEEASEAIKKGELTKEQADELAKNGKEVFDQAEEKNNAVKEEYKQIVEETKADNEAFDEAAEKAGMEEYAKRADEASNNQDKIAIIDEAEEALTPTFDEVSRIVAEIESIEDEVKQAQEKADEAEKIMAETGWIFNQLDDILAAPQRYEEELAHYEKLKQEAEEVKKTIARLQDSIPYKEGVIAQLQADYDKKTEEITQLTNKINQLLGEINNLREKQKELEERLKEVIDESEKTGIQMELEQVKSEIEEKDRQFESTNSDIDDCNNELWRIGKDKDQAEFDLSLTRSSINTNQTILSGYEWDMEESERKQSELSKYMEIDYNTIMNRYYDAWDTYETYSDIAKYRRRDLMSYDVDYYKGQKVVLQNFFDAAEKYKKSLSAETKAKELVARAETAYAKAAETYENLVNAIEEYQEAHPETPTEPEVTEVTYNESYTTNICQKVRDIFTGITAVLEGSVTTKVTTVVKTIKDAANKVTMTVVTRTVNIVGSGSLKLYDRFGRLIANISNSVNMAFGWFGGFFS